MSEIVLKTVEWSDGDLQCEDCKGLFVYLLLIWFVQPYTGTSSTVVERIRTTHTELVLCFWWRGLSSCFVVVVVATGSSTKIPHPNDTSYSIQ